MKKKLLLTIAALALAWFIYSSILSPLQLLLLPGVQLPQLLDNRFGVSLLLMIFSCAHALYTIGWRHSLLLFGLSYAISWSYEQVGVISGVIYGNYSYTDALGPKLGHVPVMIPLIWFIMIYPSYILANLIADGQAAYKKGPRKRMLWRAILSALIMTAWDLVIDPILSGPSVQAWTWHQPGPYFGVPLQNFAGWLLTTFTIYWLYRRVERLAPPRPIGEITSGVEMLPLLAYTAMMLSNIIPEEAAKLRVIGLLVMGLPVLLAARRLLLRSRERKNAPSSPAPH